MFFHTSFRKVFLLWSFHSTPSDGEYTPNHLRFHPFRRRDAGCRNWRSLQSCREREVRWIVLSARYVGKVIRPNVGRVTIGLAYVMDEAQADLPSLELSRCLYAAIGEADVR